MKPTWEPDSLKLPWIFFWDISIYFSSSQLGVSPGVFPNPLTPGWLVGKSFVREVDFLDCGWSSESWWMSRKFYIVYLSSFVPKAFRYALERILKSYVLLVSSNILSQLHYVPFFFSQFLKVNLDIIWFYPRMSIDQHNPGNVRSLWRYYYSHESEQRVFSTIYDPVCVRFSPQLSPDVYLELKDGLYSYCMVQLSSYFPSTLYKVPLKMYGSVWFILSLRKLADADIVFVT